MPRASRAPPPDGPRFGGDRLGHALLALAVGVTAAGLLLWRSAPPPLHSDTCLDLAMARDCVDGAGCHPIGQGSSFHGYRHGAGWPTLLAGGLRLGWRTEGIHVAVTLLHGIAFGLFLWTLLAHLPRHLAASALAVFAVGALQLIEYPTLWNPSLLPLGLAVLLAGMVGVLRTGRSRYGVLTLVGLAITLEAHLLGALLVLPALFVVALADRRPHGVLAVGGLGLLVLGGLVSRGTLAWNLILLQRQGALAPALGSLGLALGLGGALRARHRHDEATAVTVVGGLALLLGVALLPVLLERHSAGTPFRPRYLLPVLPLALYAGMHGLAALRRTPLRSGAINVSAVVLAVGLAAWLLPRLAQPRAYWTLGDADALATGPFARESFQGLTRRLRGPQHRDLLKCFVSLAPHPWRVGGRPTDRAALYVTRGSDPWAPDRARRVRLRTGRSAALWSLRSWIRTRPGPRSPSRAGAPHSFRDRVFQLVHSAPLQSQTLEIRIHGPDRSRRIRIVPPSSPWKIKSIDGVRHRISAHGREAELRADGPHRGRLHLVVPAPHRWFDPPSLLEK